MPAGRQVFDVVEVAAVGVWDVLELPAPVGRFEVHAITRQPVARRFRWRSRPARVTIWSDDRSREQTVRQGPGHFEFTPEARRQTLPADAWVLRLRR